MRSPVRLASPGVAGLLLAITSACTHGPPEDRAVAHTIRIPDTHGFYAAVHHERFRRPTGLVNTFPNGGVTETLDQEVHLYRASADGGGVELWATMPVPRDVWSAFSVTPVGVARDTFYIAVSGCPPGPECWGDLRSRRLYRVSADGAPVPVSAVPGRHRPPGSMLAPREGETRYMRMGPIHYDSITATFDDPELDRRVLFRIRPTGELLRPD